jgi:hypothetical protein
MKLRNDTRLRNDIEIGNLEVKEMGHYDWPN